MTPNPAGSFPTKAVLEKNPSGSLSQDVHRPLERREIFGGKHLKYWQVMEANNPVGIVYGYF